MQFTISQNAQETINDAWSKVAEINLLTVPIDDFEKLLKRLKYHFQNGEGGKLEIATPSGSSLGA